MRLYLSKFCSTLLLAAVVFGSAATAHAAGYWNVPSTFRQCMGVGWGAGYHASFVLGPITWDETFHYKEVRLPYPPSPYGGCYSDSSYCGCGQPTHLNAAVPAPAAHTTQPAAAPMPPQPLFGPPIEP